MKTVTELKAELSVMDSQLEQLETQRADLWQQIAELSTKVKVGDKVTHAETKYTWQVTAIQPGWDGKPEFMGRKLKNDGSPGAVVVRIYVPWKGELRVL